MKVAYVLAVCLAAILLAHCGLVDAPGEASDKSYPVVALPPDVDPEHENWKGIDLTPKPPVKPVPADLQVKSFQLPPGYDIAPVLTEPRIQQPGAITFDGNGRMYVLELRSYMLTIDADGELEPVSGISRWEDLDGDGVYETGGMFVDKLVFPRFVLPMGPNSILTMESNADKVFLYTDTDNDGKADKKEFFTDNFGRSGNVEHQQAFLYWAMDNWLYSTVNAFRVRPDGNRVLREATGSNKAQWGVTQDDDGKLWFQGGASGLPSYFQFPIHYGDFVVENEFAEGFEIPWGAPIKIADMQGGMDQVRQPDGSLNRVTGAAGNDIFRGHRLADDLVGQYFYGEPVARIVRQINPVVTDGLTQLENVYQEQKSEFLRSTDPLFRPVDIATAPDGTMYVVDMYHGIIQEGQWVQPGSYLRTKIQQYQLDKVIGLGRIWRITRKNVERDKTRPRMYDEPTADLIKHLDHPNGWWRDMAQQVIVQRQDKSIAPALREMARNDKNILARFHALWSLEGLGMLDVAQVRELMNDPEPRVRMQAMYASETLYKSGETSLGGDYLRMTGDNNTEVAMRAMMTANLLKVPGTAGVVNNVLKSNTAAGVQLVGKQILQPPPVRGFFARNKRHYNEQQQAMMDQGAEIYTGLCATCHGAHGAGELMAPSFVSSQRIKMHGDYVIKILLHGLTGDIDGESYGEGLMIPMDGNSDQWIASAASFIRENFENEAGLVTVDDVARVREETAGRKTPYRYDELLASIPRLLEPQPDWQVRASHSAPTRVGGTGDPVGAFSFEGWTTGVAQDKGMWFQVALPAEKTITEIHFNSPQISRGWREGSPPPLQTHPRNYIVQISSDGEKRSNPIAGGEGSPPAMRIQFKPVKTRYIRITQTGGINSENEPWSMQELKLYGFDY